MEVTSGHPTLSPKNAVSALLCGCIRNMDNMGVTSKGPRPFEFFCPPSGLNKLGTRVIWPGLETVEEAGSQP